MTMTPRPIDLVKQRVKETFGSWTRETSIDQMRADFEAMTAAPEPASRSDVGIDRIPAAWIGEAPDSAPAILFFHGGGYQIGSIDSHRDLMGRIAAATGARVLGFEYRLAPEHRFPAAIEDALAAYAWLLNQGVPASKIAFAGDSAGAGLAIATLLQAKTQGAPLPASVALMSPWLDLEAKGETYDSRAALDPMTQRKSVLAMARAYLGPEGDARDPLASPIQGDLRNLPPIQIHVGDHETVLDDSRLFAERARQNGSEVDLRVWPEMIHHFQIFPELAEAKQSIEQMADFFHAHWS